MISTLVSFIALYTSVFALLLGVGFLGTFLSLRMTLQGFSPQSIGWVMAAYYCGMVAGSFFCQRAIQWVGHIRAFAALAAVATTTVLLHGLYIRPWFWLLLRFSTGVAIIGLYMVIESWLNDRTEPHFRGRVFSIYMLILYFGMALGQLLLNVTPVRGPEPFMAAGILFSLCLIPVTVTRSISPKIPERVRFNFYGLLKKAPLGMLGCLTAGLLNGAFYAMGPVYGHRIGLTVSATTGFMAVAIFGGLAVQWPVGNISDRVQRPLVLSVLSLSAAISAVAVMALSGRSYIILLCNMVVFGGLSFTIYPVAVARTHDLCKARDVVPVSSALLLSFGIGASVGPVLAAGMMTAAKGPGGLFAFFAAAAGLYGVLSFYLVRREKIEVLPVEEQVEFAPMKNASPLAAQFDPRMLPEKGKADF